MIRFADRVRPIVSTGIDSYPPLLDALAPFDDIVSWYGANRPEFREAAAQYPVRFFQALPQSGHVHAVDFYLRQAGSVDGAVPWIDVPREDTGFVAIHPYSGSAKKNWAHFASLAANFPGIVRFCVSPEQSWPGAVQYNDLFALAKWLATARLYIGNDSGITHLAAAIGVPVIAIFETTDPRVWAPRGRASVAVLERPSLDEVLTRAESLLRSK